MSVWVAATSCFPHLDYYKGSRMEIRSYYWKVTLALALLAVAASARRESLHQLSPCVATAYWNDTLQECVKCNVCADITLRPCEAHRDALCGTVADLNIDWSWIRNPHKANHNRPEEKPRHYVELPTSWQETIREHDPEHHILRQTGDVPVLHEDELGKRTPNGEDNTWPDKSHKRLKEHVKNLNHRRKYKHHHHHHQTVTTTTTTPSPDDYNYDDYLDDPKSSSTSFPQVQATTSSRSSMSESTTTSEKESLTTKAPLRLVYKIPYGDVFYDYTVGHDEDPVDNPSVPRRRVPLPEEPFSSVETLVWDWQAVVLVSAIATCVIFFIIVVIYTCYYAQQWRKIKKTFDSDMEELSLRLNLINGMGLEHLQDPSAAPSKTLHLAHLIVQKQQEAAVNAALPGTIKPNMNLYSTATSVKKNNS